MIFFFFKISSSKNLFDMDFYDLDVTFLNNN